MHIHFSGPSLLVVRDPKSKISFVQKVDIGDEQIIDSCFEVRILPLISFKKHNISKK